MTEQKRGKEQSGQDMPAEEEQEATAGRVPGKSSAGRRLKPVLLACAAFLFVLTAAACALFLRVLLADDEAEEAHPIVLAGDNTTDAEAGRLAALLREPAAEKIVSWKAEAHRENELVFSLSMADFIESFNGFYWQDHAVRLLPPQQYWGAKAEAAAIHSDFATTYYVFSRDVRIRSLPTLSVYVPADAQVIQEITVDFDDHGFDQGMFSEYEGMSFYVLRVFFPALPEETLRSLIKTLNDYAYDHVLPNEKGYYHGAVPQVLYYQNGLGVYPYFAIGEFVHFCVIPVDAETLENFRAQGTEVKALTQSGA